MAKRKKPEKKLSRKKLESLRFERFKRLYLKSGIASRSMREAGYTEKTAHGKCTEFAGRIRASLEEAARAQGLDEVQVAAKYRQLLDAKTPKWNAETKQWDEFEAGQLQLDAADRLADILEPKVLGGGFLGKGGKLDPSRPVQVLLIHNVPRARHNAQTSPAPDADSNE